MPIREVHTNEIPDGILDFFGSGKQSKGKAGRPKGSTNKKQNSGVAPSKPEPGLGNRATPPKLPPHLQDYVDKAKKAPKAKSPMDLVRMLHGSNKRPPGY